MTNYTTEQEPKQGAPKIDQTVPSTISRTDEILERMINFVPEEVMVQPDLATNSTPEDSDAVDKHRSNKTTEELAAEALLENIGLVRSVAYSSRGRKYNEGLNGSIRRTTKRVRGKFGSISDYDDAFQDACEAFLRKYNMFDPEKGTLGNYMPIWMNQAIDRAVGNTTRHVRYPIGVQNKIDPIIFLSNESVPDTDGMGYDDASDGYLERWLPQEDIGLTPKHDVAYYNSNDDFKPDHERKNVDDALSKLISVKKRSGFLDDEKQKIIEEILKLPGLDITRDTVDRIIISVRKSILEALESTRNKNRETSNRLALNLLIQRKLRGGGEIIDSVVYSRSQVRKINENYGKDSRDTKMA